MPASTDRQDSPASTSLQNERGEAASALVTLRDIYEHLECSQRRRKVADIQALLESRSEQLRNCDNPFPPPSTVSMSKVTSGTIQLSDGTLAKLNDEQKELVVCISERYELDEVVATTLLRSFLESEERSLDVLRALPTEEPQRKGKRKMPSDRNDFKEDFLDAFNVFFFEERLYLLRIVSALLRICNDANHEYHEVSLGIIAPFAEESFGLRCLERFRAISREPLSEKVRNTPRYAAFWAKQKLREQLGLLEVVFLLFYARLSSSAHIVLQCMTILTVTNLGREQVNSGFFDSEAVELVRCISHLLILVSVESLELERVMDGIDLNIASATLAVKGKASSTASGRHLTEVPELLDEALDMLERTAPDPYRAPLLLAWALVTNRIDTALADRRADPTLPPRLRELENVLSTDDNGGPIWTRLATAAFAPAMDLFGTLADLLTSPLMGSSSLPLSNSFSASSLAYRSIIKGMVLSITELIRPEFIPNFDGLVSLWELTFGGGALAEAGNLHGEDAADLCVQFWESDFRFHTRRGILDTARRRWPVSFLPLVRLARALSGASSATASVDGDPDEARLEAIARASQAVLQYISQLPTLAHVLPPVNRLLGSEYEPYESDDYNSNAYHATRRIPVFGHRTFVEKETIGTVVSDVGSAPVIIVWDLEEPINGWHLMVDVLASFAGMLQQSALPGQGDNPVSLRAVDDIFQDSTDRIVPTDFAGLSPDTSAEQYSQTQADILDLFSSIIASGPEQAMTFFAHLRAKANSNEGMTDDGDDNAASMKSVDIIQVVIRILDQSLASHRSNIRLITSAYNFLVSVLPYKPAEVWLALRACDIVTGSPRSAVNRSHASMYGRLQAGLNATSSILALEIAHASFRATISMLDLTLALLLELQRSQFSSHPEQLKIKADVVRRGIEWVSSSIWPEFQSWKYRLIKEKLSIGLRCVRIFEIVLTDTSFRHPPTGDCAALSESLKQFFVTKATLVQLAPLVTILGTGSSLFDELTSFGRQNEVQTASSLIEASLRFARVIVMQRQEDEAIEVSLAVPLRMCMFEHLFFDHATVATRTARAGSRRAAKITLANSILSLVVAPLSLKINTEAARLVHTICRSTAESANGVISSMPNLGAFLGTTVELEETLGALIDLVVNTQQDAELRVYVWTMLGAVIETQPSLATLLLTGRHLAQTTEQRLAGERGAAARPKMSAEEGTSTTQMALSRTSVEVAAQSVDIWEEYWASDPQLLEAVLRFFCIVWTRGVEHANAFETLRSKKSFWAALSCIATHTVGEAPSRPTHFEEIDGVVRTNQHSAVSDYAHRTLCKARALQLLSIDLQMPLPAGQLGDTLSLATCISIVRDNAKLESALRSATDVHCDPELQAEVHSRMTATIPEVPLSAVHNLQRQDQAERHYGDDYIYDGALLRCKLEGFINLEVGAQEEELDPVTIQQASLLVAAVNLDWSVVDAETTLLRAWTSLLEGALGRVIASTMGKQAEEDIERSCTAAWIACATIAAEERCGGDLKASIHAERIRLLTVLLEAAWRRWSDQTLIDTPSEKEESILAVDRVVQLTCELVEHDVFSTLDSIRVIRGPPFFRNLYRIVLLSTLRMRHFLKWTAAHAPADLQSERHRRLHKCSDTISTQVIAGLRDCIDVASRRESAAAIAMEQTEQDLTLLVSVLELLLRSDFGIVPHFWLLRFQQTGLLSACISLLGSAPIVDIQGLVATSESMTVSRLLYSQPMLFLALAIASQSGAAEQLAAGGFMSALTANGLTATIESGALTTALPTGERNPAQTSWVLMLRTATRLVEQLTYPGAAESRWAGSATRFVESDVVGFVRIYGSRIGASLDFSPFLSNPSFLKKQVTDHAVGQTSTLTIAQLEETLAIVQLFLCMARDHGTPRKDDSAPLMTILSTFALSTAKLLQQLVYLLQHPRELASFVNAGIDSHDLTHAAKLQLLREEDEAQALVRKISTIVVQALWEYSDSSLVLLRDSHEWTGVPIVIRPTARTSLNEMASLGTLFDLVAHTGEHLRSPSIEEADATADVLMIEQALALCTTQLAVSAYGKTDVAGGRLELEAGVTRDLLTSLSAARGALVDAPAAAVAVAHGEEEGSLLHALEHFVRARLVTTRPKSTS